MNSKEKVLSVYPDATVWAGEPYRSKYRVMPMPNDDPEGTYRPPLGFGNTADSAWDDAAKRLPSAPSPAGETANQCDGCALGLPIDGKGNHLREGAVFGIHMACTKHKYAAPIAPAAVPESTELLPCPFCGSEGVVHEGDQIFWTECHTCNLDLEYQTTREAAIAAWNTRKPAAYPVAGVSAGQVELLRKAEAAIFGMSKQSLNCEHACAFINQAIELAKPSAEGDGWIAVTPENLPEEGEKVMAYRNGVYALGYRSQLLEAENVYWRPLPAPPSGQGEVK